MSEAAAPTRLDGIRRLFEHAAWADAAVAGALRAAADAPAALELYAHVLGAELVWLDRVLGRPASAAVWPRASPAECETLAERSRTEWTGYLASLADADLERPVSYVNSAGKSFVSLLVDILQHVALHGAYHRGQIATLLRQAGAQPAATDYIAFVRGVPAATRADARR